MFIKSLQIGFVGVVLCAAGAWAAQIQGTVTDANGKPIKSADVRIQSSDGKQLFKTVKTDAQGRYISEPLPYGTYRVTLVVNGAVKASIKNTKTKADESTLLNFDLRPLPAGKVATAEKKGKHLVWVPAPTGTHLGGHWEEVPDGAARAGTLNVQKANAEQLQRQVESMGSGGTGR